MRINVDVDKLRLALGDTPHATLRSEFGVSRAATNVLADSNQHEKKFLFSAFEKLWGACEQFSTSSAGEYLRTVEEDGEEHLQMHVDGFMSAVGKFTNAAEVLTSDALVDFERDYFQEVKAVDLRPGDLSSSQDRFLGLNWSVDHIRWFKSRVDGLSSILQMKHAFALREEVESAERYATQMAFLSENPGLFRSQQFGWLTTSTELISKNKEALTYISKALEGDVPKDAEAGPAIGTLNTLINQSEEAEKLKTLVKPDLVYDEFKIFYAPFWVRGDFKLILEDNEWDGEEITTSTEVVNFDFKVARAIHCLIVAPPDAKAVVVRAPAEFNTVTKAESQPYDGPFENLTVTQHDQNLKLTGVKELMDVCFKREIEA
jgi:hypothetical protein